MQVNSFIFILAFLPITALLYFAANKWSETLGKLVIIFSSIVFYVYSNIYVAPVLAASILLNFASVYLMQRFEARKKLFLFLPVAINVGLLGYYKYANFAISNYNAWFSQSCPLRDIVFPVGISFFTFQQIAYCVEVYNERLKLKLIDYLAFILYFPKILMGPLMDPVDFSQQINDSALKKVDYENIACGLKILSFGLFKKMLLADTLGKAVDWGFANVDKATSMDFILIMLFYTFQIFFDFSGYCDIVIGASAMLNIKLPIDFDSPYKAICIRDFWRRWHITLNQFLAKYIYIPLGGNRKGALFTCLNIFVVFTVSGVWHGANWTFILWGILHGLFCSLDHLCEKLEDKVLTPVRCLVTFVIINFQWLLFRSESVSQWLGLLKKIVGVSDTNVSPELLTVFKTKEVSFLCGHISYVDSLDTTMPGLWLGVFMAFVFSLHLLPGNTYRRFKNNSAWIMLLAALLFVWALLCLGSESVFIYSGF